MLYPVPSVMVALQMGQYITACYSRIHYIEFLLYRLFCDMGVDRSGAWSRSICGGGCFHRC